MPVIYGVTQVIDNVFPDGIDPAIISQRAREEGVSEEQALALVATYVGRQNQRIAEMYRAIVSLSDGNYVLEYQEGTGARRMTPLASELGQVDPVGAARKGHMLPRYDFEDAIAMTRDFERRGNINTLASRAAELGFRWLHRVDHDIWTRALRNDEVALSASGYSVGWAQGSGVSVPFIPPDWSSNTFTSSHSHYLVSNSTTEPSWAIPLNRMVEELRHHGHLQSEGAQIIIYTSTTDALTINALAEVAKIENPNFILVGGNANSPVRYSQGLVDGAPGDVYGFFKSDIYGTAELRTHPRIPANYAFATASYGDFSPKNGLAIYTESDGFGMRVAREIDNRISGNSAPKITKIITEATHGVGVGMDRTNGVALYRAAGATTYVNPTIA